MARGRVNPIMPVLIALAGLGILASGNWRVGVGVAVGAILAYGNGLILSRRVDLAALSGNVPAALLVMQAGLLVSLTIVGISTVILVKISVAMGVASAAGFAAAQFAILAMFYWTHGRGAPAAESRV